MTSVFPTAPKERSKHFSLLLHFASLILLIVCVYCIIVLFRDLRRLEALVKDKTILVGVRRNGDRNGIQEAIDNAARIRRRSQNDDDLYEMAGDDDVVNEDSPGEGAAKQTVTRSTDPRVNLGGSKLTIVTKDDERLLLQTADGSPWALLPSLTRISLSTLEDFCLTTHQYCANKNQVVRPIPGRQGSAGGDCDGRCSNRRSNNGTPRDLDGQQTATNGDGSPEPTKVQQHAPRTISSPGPASGVSSEVFSTHGYDSDVQYLEQTTSISMPEEHHASSPKRRKGLGLKKRKRERCFIEHIGSPPFMMGQREVFHGSWMQDASPREDFDADKRWVTEHVEGQLLFEFASPTDLSRGGSHGDVPVKIRSLPHMFDGTNHIIYNGTLIYKRLGAPSVIRFDLRTENYTETRIPGAAYRHGDYLYNDDSMAYFDLAMDENGLWVFFHYEKRKVLSVARLHPKTMRIIRVWNLTRFDHTQMGDTWVACGVMYVLDSRKAHDTRVSVAYDLFRHRLATVNMPWRNPYNLTSMVTYNPKIRRLHIYDNGFLLERNLLMAFPGKEGGVI